METRKHQYKLPISSRLLLSIVFLRVSTDAILGNTVYSELINGSLLFCLILAVIRLLLAEGNLKIGAIPLLFGLLIIASYLYSLINGSEFWVSTIYLGKITCLLFLVVFFSNSKEDDKYRIRRNLINLAGLSSILSFLQSINLIPFFEVNNEFVKSLNSLGRSGGLFLWPNIAIVIYAITIIHIVASSNEFGKRYRMVMIPVLAIGCLGASSLAGSIALIVGLLYCIYRLKSFRYFSLFILSSVVVLLTIVNANLTLWKRLLVLFQSSSDPMGMPVSENSAIWRFNLWRETLPYVKERFVFGYGLGTADNIAAVNGYIPHNDFLRIALEFGLVGLGLFIVTLFLIWNKIENSIYDEKEIFSKAILLVVMVASFGENIIYQIVVYIYTLCFLYCQSSVNLSREKVTQV